MASPDDMLTPKEAAEILGISPETLKDWRRADAGPDFCRYETGTVRYKRADVIAYREQCMRRLGSTT